MTITIPIRPEVEAELARQAASHGSAIEAYAATLLEGAVQVSQSELFQAPATRRTGQTLIDAFAEIRGLLTDEDIDQIFRRDTSPARTVDLS